MRKILFIALVLCVGISVYGYNIDTYRQSVNKNKTDNIVEKNIQNSNEKREIKNIDEYFRYLSHEVQRNWIPYKSNLKYEVKVQFTIYRDGTISDVKIAETTLRDANVSVLNAVKAGAPYQPLPQSYSKDKVTAQIILGYSKN